MQVPLRDNLHSKKGFTLVELSIVLVIIGLIAGGVLVGKELIAIAELRKIMSQPTMIGSAVQTFKIKYNGLPGDMADASDIFGLDPEGCSFNNVPKTPKNQTCNGNGNNQIEAFTGNETYTFWQQLAAASLISGVYRGSIGISGSYIDSSNSYSIDSNNMWLAYSGITRALADALLGNGNGYYNSYYNSNILFGYGVNDVGNGEPLFLTPAQAFAWDQKEDDGIPAHGKLQSLNSQYAFSRNCVTTDDETARYKTDYNSKACGMIVIGAF